MDNNFNSQNNIHSTNNVDFLQNRIAMLEGEIALRDYNSRYDRNTGLHSAMEFFCLAKSEMQNNLDITFCFIVLDIRQFKLVNDIYGFIKGNEVLKIEADIIKKTYGDKAIYGRIHADCFAICINEQYYDEAVLLKLISTCESEISKIGINVLIQAGVCPVPNNTIDPPTVMDWASVAIRTIKNNYKSKIAYFKDNMREEIIGSQKMILDFEKAIKEEQFCLYIQPQFTALDEKAQGGEVLVRWIHPDKGIISPGLFIPTFEETGLISILDRYVWRKACELLQKWKNQGKDNIYLSINISPFDLQVLDIYEVMTDLVEEYNINPTNLKLEITETAVMTDIERQLFLIEKLKAYGFTVEMDDFGSGYSSLNMLKDINVNTLKIDMMFLGKTDNTTKSDLIIKTIIFLSKELGMNVITEGVETVDQVEFLKSNGCDIFQGYYYAKPMPVPEFEQRFV